MLDSVVLSTVPRDPLPSPPLGSASLAFSKQLKIRTAPLHAQIEDRLGLPGALASPADYRDWLLTLLGFYEPLERSLAAFPHLATLGFDWTDRRYTARLAEDLAALGMDPQQAPRISPSLAPSLPTLAHAVGALYVIEGATLGGRIILRDVQARIGSSIAGADQFLVGGGDCIGPAWNRFRTAVDNFGNAQPHSLETVLIGAERTFAALLSWCTQSFASRARS